MGEGLDTAVYGFVAWVGVGLLLAVYVVWAVLPDDTLSSFGLEYHPDQYWAVGGPALLSVAVYLYFAVTFLLFFRNTAPVDSQTVLTDSQARRYKDHFHQHSAIPPLVDLPLHAVCSPAAHLRSTFPQVTEALLKPH
eukprot:Sspe_Gene.46875::Locus_23579_Transcript_1_1_Confidence_1.000_Length_870::g.46875::m.46875/K03861/PIGP, GPI19, DSCR5; phosphatidylinositol glycan, class P